MSDDLILKIIVGGGLSAYFIWLGKTLFDIALAVKQIKIELVGTQKENGNHSAEILRTRQRLHNNENKLQEHELRLTVLEEARDITQG